MGASTNSASGAIIAFSGVSTTTPFDVASGTISVQASQTNVIASAKTTVTPNTAIIMLGEAAGSSPTWSSWTTTTPGALTELFDVQQNSGVQTSVGGAWALKPTTGTTGAGGATLSASERNGGIILTLRPCISAGAASSTPTLCINTVLTAITHTTTGATGIGAATGLPAGVTAAWASNTITISGTPTASGTFNYSIPLTGGCVAANATGTIDRKSVV